MGTGGALVVAAIAWNTWNASASRFALFLCAAALVAPFLDVAWAATVTRRVTLKVETVSTDLQVGDGHHIRLAVGGPHLPFELRVPAHAAPVRCQPPESDRLAGHADRREVVSFLDAEVASRGVLGLMAFARRQRLPLPHPLHIGPRPQAPSHPFPEVFGAWGDGAPRPATSGDVVRGVRGYVPGDPVRRVHWPATARTGDLVVKEVEESGAPRLLIALDLGGGGEAGEQAASRAAWYAYEALGRGYDVTLATAEPAGPVTATVGPAYEVNRRLARATRGQPRLPTGRPAGSAVVFVTAHGDTWPS